MRVGVIVAAVAPGLVRLGRSGRRCGGRPGGKRQAAFRAAQLAGAIAAIVVGAYLSVAHVASAAEELAFDLTVSSSGLAQRTVTGRIALDDGKFDAFFNQNGVKLHLSGNVVGDAISIYGTINTGYMPAPGGFRVDGQFKEGRFEQRYMTTSGTFDSYRGAIVISRAAAGDVGGATTN
ncbi:MAG TPA: hypothetical protein VLV76_19195 [Candidatus Acidoferrum sp.]|nr:hypothetical protein [Candidatus Acidoferrum sp.]